MWRAGCRPASVSEIQGLVVQRLARGTVGGVIVLRREKHGAQPIVCAHGQQVRPAVVKGLLSCLLVDEKGAQFQVVMAKLALAA